MKGNGQENFICKLDEAIILFIVLTTSPALGFTSNLVSSFSPNAEKLVQHKKAKLKQSTECLIFTKKLDELAPLSLSEGLTFVTLNNVMIAAEKNGCAKNGLDLPTAENLVKAKQSQLKNIPQCEVYSKRLDEMRDLYTANASTFISIDKIMKTAQKYGCLDY